MNILIIGLAGVFGLEPYIPVSSVARIESPQSEIAHTETSAVAKQSKESQSGSNGPSLSIPPANARQKPLTVTIGKRTLEGIKQVKLLSSGRVTLAFDGGIGAWPMEDLPEAFLKAWLGDELTDGNNREQESLGESEKISQMSVEAICNIFLKAGFHKEELPSTVTERLSFRKSGIHYAISIRDGHAENIGFACSPRGGSFPALIDFTAQNFLNLTSVEVQQIKGIGLSLSRLAVLESMRAKRGSTAATPEDDLVRDFTVRKIQVHLYAMGNEGTLNINNEVIGITFSLPELDVKRSSIDNKPKAARKDTLP